MEAQEADGRRAFIHLEPHADDGAGETREIAGALLDRLLRAPVIQDYAPIVVAAFVVAMLFNEGPRVLVLAWFGLTATANIGRTLVRRRLAARAARPDVALPAMRIAVGFVTVSWATAPILFSGYLDDSAVALLAMVYAGLIAAATTTLVADRSSFRIYAWSLLGSLCVAFWIQSTLEAPLIPIGLILFYAFTVESLYKHNARHVMGLLATARELRISREHAARERGFLDALFLGAPVAIATVSEGARVIAVNPAFERLFGYPSRTIEGTRLADAIVPPDLVEESDALDRRMADGEVLVLETRRRHRDGHDIDVRVTGSKAGAGAGGAGFVLYDDITERNRVQSEILETEGKYRHLVESASDLVFQIDGTGRWSFLNASCQNIYGAPHDELIGRSVLEFADPAHRDADVDRFRQLLDGEAMADYETVHVDTGGRGIHLSFSARPLRDSQGRITGAHGTARDVTSRARALEEAERARLAAEHAAAVKTAFLANMSHEIRTPMNGVLGMTDLLLDTDLDFDQQRSLDLIRSSAESLLAIINDILDYSRMEAGRIVLESEPFDLHGLVDAAVRLLSPRAMEKRIELTYEILPGAPRHVRGDPGRIRQVITNLLGNAVKFTSEGEVVVTVREIGGAEDLRRIEIAVRDTGIGIEPGNVNAIFEEFNQADATTTRRFGGTGLGLAIARHLAQLMDGEIIVESQPDFGSTFTFRFSIQAVTDAGDDARRKSTATLAGRHAMVVDDNRTNRRILRDMLKSASMEVVSVASARLALEQLCARHDSGQRFDIILVDSRMPRRDGFSLASDVRSDTRFDDTHLIMLTSGGTPGDGQRCRDLGIDGYLTKPISRAELFEAMASIFAGSADGAPGRKLVTRHSIAETRRSLHVLLAEDNPVNQEVAARMLRKRGHHVCVVGNGREAVDAVAREAFDLILMDVQMPELDGLTATRQIRTMPGRETVRIIALTAHALADERQRCLDAGMDGHVTKPFRPHELFAAVEGWAAQAAASATPRRRQDETVDVAAFRATLAEAGIEEIFESMVQTFLDDSPARLAALEAACAIGDPGQIRAAAHGYKSSALTLSADRLGELLRQAEYAGRDGETGTARALMPAIRELTAAALEQLASIVGTPAKI